MTFEEALENVKLLKEKPSNENLLKLYSLFKQATEGDAPADGGYAMFDFVAKAKHDAWLEKRGIDSEEAKNMYIALVEELSK